MNDDAVASIEEAKSVRAATGGRRSEILSAAARCFAEQGYHTVGMREIATAVGIKGASLYNHFSSKEEIMYAIALGMTRDLVDQHMPLLDAAGTPTQRLTGLIRAHICTLTEKRVEHLVSLRELTALTPEHLAVVTDIRKYYQRRIRDVIAAGVRSGEFAVGNPGLAAIALLDMMNGISWWLRADQDMDDLIENYVGFALDGILQSRRRGDGVQV
ncbi:TetR/AcrR family transcriptional regulator [Rhodococcus sp. ABRD24]|uniref:TetR/AcrR family transcriptional regulator n=1 Tax=Rhodococcus sp. ABRD24 TaxID=2507582 RepID=UPI00104084DF|nr:TetR/AcrR family transcriptional regulator [Rhodococcus sp. ABRD24]QBJ95763.1 TetR/AcrR family transcriptional regulator [Rhodococcus sp. ABRD24]